MNWKQIKSEISNELNSQERNLTNPSIRLYALNSIEVLFQNVILENPELLQKIGKEHLIDALKKMKKLNGAEKSIVNNVYSVLNREQIPVKRKINTSYNNEKQPKHQK